MRCPMRCKERFGMLCWIRRLEEPALEAVEELASSVLASALKSLMVTTELEAAAVVSVVVFSHRASSAAFQAMEAGDYSLTMEPWP